MLKGAIIGFGEVARHGHWPAYEASRDISIVAVVDRSAGRRALAASLSPGIATFSSMDGLLQWAGQGGQAGHVGRARQAGQGGQVGQAGRVENERIDFVDICTPPAMHAEPMLAAIERGWHV